MTRSGSTPLKRMHLTVGAPRATAAVVVTVLALLAVLVASAPWAVTTQRPDVVAVGQGPLPADRGASCAFVYSPKVLAEQVTFAFDGTISAIDTGNLSHSNRVTFEVNRWFRGPQSDAPSSITLPMSPAEPRVGADGTPREDSQMLTTPTYTVGTRLLVAGASRFGGGPLNDPVVWSCDFTRYYEKTTAEEWATALT